MAGAQNQFNNRISETMSYLHSWSITAGDNEPERITREWFKNVSKYGLFPDGTFWELIRNKNAYNISFLGVLCSFSTLHGMVQMAHVDAMANHFPNDRLYDYSTTDGVVNNSTTMTDTHYVGTSTTDGTTEKSILLLIKG